MALKSILDIDINDEKFKSFQAAFAKYSDALKKMPGAWGKINTAQTESFETVTAITAAILAQNEMLQDNERAGERVNRITRNNAIQWRDIARSTKEAARSVLDAAKTAVRWSGVTGLLGAGGMYGIDRMADSVSAKFRNAQGLGLSTGQMKGLGLGLSQVVDPESYLSNINRLRHNVEGARPLFGAGVRDLSPGRDNASIAKEVLLGLKDQADRYKGSPQILGTMMAATGTDQIVTLEDMVRLQSMSRKEIDEFLKLVDRTSKAAELSEETQKAWRSLKLTLDEAGLRIGAVFIRGLSGLTVPLSHLSDRVVAIVEAFAKSGGFEKLVDDVGDGLETLANWIGSGQFKKDAESFADAVGTIADAAVSLASVLKWIIDKSSTTRDGFKAAGRAASDPEFMVNPFWVLGRHAREVAAERAASEASNDNQPGGGLAVVGSEAWRRKNPGVTVKGGAGGGGLSRDQALDLLRNLENSGDRAVSPKGAIGRYQIMPKTAEGLGYQPHEMLDPVKGREAASKLLDELKTTFKGDLAAMLVAYNAGPTRAKAWIEGGRNNDSLPAETRAYLDRAARLIAQGVKVTTVVTAAPGSDYNTQTRTAAGG